MTIINLKEMYSGYYIRKWKAEGLPLIKERPPTTTEELLESFFRNRNNTTKYRKKVIARNIERGNKRKSQLDWRDYLKGEYK